MKSTIYTKRKSKDRVSKGSTVPVPLGRPLDPKKQNRPLMVQTKDARGPRSSKFAGPMLPTSVANNQGKPLIASRRDPEEVEAGGKPMEKRSLLLLGPGSITPSNQTKRQIAQTVKVRKTSQVPTISRPSPQPTGKIAQKKASRRKASTGLGQPSEQELANRPDNRLCILCPGYVHKDRLCDHFRTKHGMSEQDVVLAFAAANPVPKSHTSPKVRITAPARSAAMPEPKRKVETTYAQMRQEMKEASREIDRRNFPPGARLTSNSSDSLPSGGGIMSKK